MAKHLATTSWTLDSFSAQPSSPHSPTAEAEGEIKRKKKKEILKPLNVKDKYI